MSFRPYHQAYTEDPYFQKEYMECYLEEGDSIFEFSEESGEDFLCFRSIKKPIAKVGSKLIEGEWYDLESVYGFGGYITNSESPEFVAGALDRLAQKCESEGIIAHFMRFHPLNDFIDRFGDLISFKAPNRKVIFVDVDGRPYEEARTGYSSSLKRNINKAKRLGLEVEELSRSADTQKTFMELYYATMERKAADEMYFFSEDYFAKLFEFEKLRVFSTYYGDEIISMILALDSGKGEVYYHLGATHKDYYSYNPNPFVLDQIVQRVKEEGGSFPFLGGGNSNEPDDPLFRFKKKFSKEYEEFYIGGSIFNQGKFEELKALAAKIDPNLPPRFLSYRFA